jgi:hypothetical protein
LLGRIMTCPNKHLALLLMYCIAAALFPLSVRAADIPHPETYLPTVGEVLKHKDFYDDPRPWLKTFGPKQALPPELYTQLTYDIETMKTVWADLVGFKSPDMVGKIAPEIKPGAYTHKDLKKYPGLRALMPPNLYNRIKPGAPPFAGNIPEFEIIPTRQYYAALPVAEATKRNQGKTKLNEDGYLIWETWDSGYPFPRPSGEYKAQQIMYNVERRYLSWGGNFYLIAFVRGYNKRLQEDMVLHGDTRNVRLAGRVLSEPYGWLDERARKRGESRAYVISFMSPRDLAGTVQSSLYYLDSNKADQLMMYIPFLRRIRKMSSTDSQDPVAGQDLTYDDAEGFLQKLSPTRYPYAYKVIEEREYLIPAYTLDGTEHISSKGIEYRNAKFERRPMYVLELTQLDPNYVYSKRIFYIDQETFNYVEIDNYDQTGRLYRTFVTNWGFHPEMGGFSVCGNIVVMRDHVDLHTTIGYAWQVPAFWKRNDVNMRNLIRLGK